MGKSQALLVGASRSNLGILAALCEPLLPSMPFELALFFRHRAGPLFRNSPAISNEQVQHLSRKNSPDKNEKTSMSVILKDNQFLDIEGYFKLRLKLKTYP